MTCSTPLATDEIKGVILEVIALEAFDDVVVQWQGIDKLEPPAADVDWMRVTVEHDSGNQASLAGADGARRWRRTGTVIVQNFAQLNKGSSDRAEEMACAVRDAYQGRATESGVWFRNCGIREVGPDKFWYQTNAFATFEYDEVN